MKKILSVLLTAVLVLSLAACGGSPAPAPAPAPAPSNDARSPAPAPPPAGNELIKGGGAHPQQRCRFFHPRSRSRPCR